MSPPGLRTLKCRFRVEEERMSGENCTGGSKTGWHNKPPPQTELTCQNNVSMAKRLPTALTLSVKKFKEADLRNHN